MGPVSGTRENAGSEAPGRDDWPEERPVAWRLLARLDSKTGVSRLFGTDRDVILLYHSVGGIPGVEYDWNLTETEFRRQIEMVCERFEPVDLPKMLRNGRTGTTPKTDSKRVAITFDDGFRNFYTTAMPVLREFDVPATVFVCPAFFDTANRDLLRERHGLGPTARDIALTERQVAEIAATDLFTVGNHTMTHARLSSLDSDDAVTEEIGGAKERLEALTGAPVKRFSYPYGEYDPRVAAVVSGSHSLAATSEPGLVVPPRDPYRLPRVDTCLPLDLLRFETTDLGDRLRRTARRVGRLVS